MARKNWNDDYIPNAADIAAKQDEMKEWQKTHSDPRHDYKVTYEAAGAQRSETVCAVTAEEAVASVKQQWGMVGVIPLHVMAEQILADNK